MTACRKNLLLSGLALSVALLVSSGSHAEQPLGPRARLARSKGTTPSIRFRFHAGAPLLAPATVGPSGAVIVGTEDGYVHALRADGSYQWSFTVRGAVSHAPLATAELVLVPTSEGRIYALGPEGALVWIFAAPAGVESELVQAPGGLVYFLGRDRYVYGVTVHGSVALRLPAGDASVGPVLTRSGDVWLGSASGELRRPRLAGSVQIAVGGPVRAGLEAGDGLYWLVGQDLLRTGEDGSTRYRVEHIAGSAGPAAVTDTGDCVWLDLDGKVSARLPRCTSGSARLALGSEGELWLAGDDGRLTLATPAGASSLAVAASRLLAPIWSPSAGELVVSAREGLVLGVAR